jgi:hypothetical protein
MAIRNIRRQASNPLAAPGTPNASPIYVDSDDNRLKLIPASSGTTEVTIHDSGNAVTSTVSTAANGYATGAGGAVTQATNASTGVTLSKPCGQITTVALTTAAAAEERFTVTNTLVAATDVIALSTTYNGAGTPMLSVVNVTAGAFDIVVTNVHAANALNALMVINFAVIKSVAA